MQLRVTYDPAADAAYVYFSEIEPAGVARTVEAIPARIMLDFDRSNRLVGVEIVGARCMLPFEVLKNAELPTG